MLFRITALTRAFPFSAVANKALNPRYFSAFTPSFAIPKKNKLPPRPKWLIIEEEIDEKFLKGGRGPGGQKINKTNSKVQLTHKPTGLVVTCQYSRSQESNRKRAREILAMKLEDLQNPEGSRNAVLNTRMKMVKESKMKKSNKKYKEIEEKRLEEKKKRELEDKLLLECFDEGESDILLDEKPKVDQNTQTDPSKA